MSEAIRILFQETHDFVVLLRSDRALEDANAAFLSGVRGAARGLDFMRTIPPHARERVHAELVRAAGGDEVLLDVPHDQPDGTSIGVEYRFFPAEGGRVAGIGRVRGGAGSDRDDLERTKAELRTKSRMLDEIQLELTQVPFVDPVTGVWNRMQVFERLTAEWSRCERYGHSLSLLLVDVEALSAIRAADGSDHAHRVLKAVARRIKTIVRDHDIVGRYGDDCFVVVAVHADLAGAQSLARRIQEGVGGEPIAVDHRTSRIDVRIGGATNGSDGVEIMEDLFQVAERSLEEARASDARFKVAQAATA